MPNDRRERHLRKERARKQRSTPAMPSPAVARPPANTAEYQCSNKACRFTFRAKNPLGTIGFQALNGDEPVSPGGSWSMGTACPVCGADAAATNTVSVVEGGVSYVNTASTPEELQRFLDEVAELRRIKTELEVGDLEVGDAVSRLRALGGGYLRLADWIESHPKNVALIIGILAFIVPAIQDAISAGAGQLADVIESAIQEFEDGRR